MYMFCSKFSLIILQIVLLLNLFLISSLLVLFILAGNSWFFYFSLFTFLSVMIIIIVPRYLRPTLTGLGTQNSISLLTCSITGLCSQTFLVSAVQGPGANLQISTSRHSPFS